MCEGILTQRIDEYDLYIDGLLVARAPFQDIDKFNVATEHAYAFYKLLFDDVNFDYVLGIMPGITFEKSFEIRYSETYGQNPLVTGQLLYTSI